MLVLAIGVKVQGMTLYSTYNTNSVEGNYYGALFFSFSSTNSSDYSNNSWKTTADNETYPDPGSGAQIEVDFTAGLAEAPNELNISYYLNVNDPALGSVAGSLGGYDEAGGTFQPGQPKDISYVYDGTSSYYSFTLGSGGTCDFGFSLPVDFDGTSGSGVGSWYANYPAPPITSTPEPAVTLELALGGFCLWLARARQRRRN